MRRSFLSVCLVLTALPLTGCDSKAQEYAASLSGLLDSLRKQATRKLVDEHRRYQAFAQRRSAALETDEISNLRIDRTTVAREAAEQLLDGSIKGGEIMARLREYAERDFTTMQAIFGASPDAELDAIRGLHHLSLEKAKLDALHEALEGLAKKQGLLETANQLAGVGKEVKGNLDFHHCEDLDQQVQSAAANLKALHASLRTAPDDSKPGIQAEITTATAALKALEAEREATGRYEQDKGCSRP